MYLRLTLACLLALGVASGGPVPAQTTAPPRVEPEPEEPTVFPDGEHRDDVFYRCTACHGSDLVRAQGHTRERWAEVLAIMVERHNMPALEGDELNQTLDYLARAFPPKGKGYTNPFLNRRPAN